MYFNDIYILKARKQPKVLEDCPWFNAGKGAVYTVSGKHDLDAGIMDGLTGSVGGVTYINRLKNPIVGADTVRVHSRHSLLAGTGAEDFCAKNGVEIVEPTFFDTEYRKRQLDHVLATSGSESGNVKPALDHDVDIFTKTETVGAVALDTQGNLASGSSTGGQTAKLDGRCSDTSIAGAGFYATPDVAISGTGDGDGFISKSACSVFCERYANEVAASNFESGGQGDVDGKILRKVGDDILFNHMKEYGAGAVILDKFGNIAMPFNTVGMFRGYLHEDMDKPYVAIWKNDNDSQNLEIFG